MVLNSILKNATIVVPFKYVSNFWLEMPSINCNVELKVRWMKHWALAGAGVENDNADSNNNNFTIEDTKLYLPVVILSAKDNQKLSKLLSKGFVRSVYWNEHKIKSENKNTTNN